MPLRSLERECERNKTKLYKPTRRKDEKIKRRKSKECKERK